jgi:predicted membrane GTPase involved in stress response
MPQTRFVLQKALELGLKPIVVVNKVDKPNCTPDIAHEKVFDLMYSLPSLTVNLLSRSACLINIDFYFRFSESVVNTFAFGLQ